MNFTNELRKDNNDNVAVVKSEVEAWNERVKRLSSALSTTPNWSYDYYNQQPSFIILNKNQFKLPELKVLIG